MRTIGLMALLLFGGSALAQTEEEAMAIFFDGEEGLPGIGLSNDKADAIAVEAEKFHQELRTFVKDTKAAICAKQAHYEQSPEDLAGALQAADTEFKARQAAHAEAIYSRLTSTEKEELHLLAVKSVTIDRSTSDTAPDFLLSGKLTPTEVLSKMCGGAK